MLISLKKIIDLHKFLQDRGIYFSRCYYLLFLIFAPQALHLIILVLDQPIRKDRFKTFQITITSAQV